MANTNLIYTYIQDSGYKLQYVASVLHISSNTLRHKLLGETQFKLDEAERLSTMLGLTMAERDACFSIPRTGSRAVQRWSCPKGEAPVTPEQRDVTRNALRKYGERHWARTPENRRWQSAIDEASTTIRRTTPCGQTCCGCAFLSSARRTRS
ncbi:MAG: hypothetical protein ACLVJH_03345 [Faecalibacterium prausnitzii]